MNRITPSMMFRTFMHDYNGILSRYDKASTQLSSLKKIQRPEDDPAGVTKLLRLRYEHAGLERFLQNIETGSNYLSATDSALASAHDLLSQARENAVYGVSADAETRSALAAEVEELLEEMTSVANTRYRGRYIFGGTETMTQPVDENGVFQGNNEVIEIEADHDYRVPINITAGQAFYANNDAFATLSDLAAALRANDTTAIEETLGRFDTDLDQLESAQARAGSRLSRLEDTKLAIEDRDIALLQEIFRTEDADVAEAASNLSREELALQITLSIGARIGQASLFNYLA